MLLKLIYKGEPPHLRMQPLKVINNLAAFYKYFFKFIIYQAMYMISSKDPPRLDANKWSNEFCDFIEKAL